MRTANHIFSNKDLLTLILYIAHRIVWSEELVCRSCVSSDNNSPFRIQFGEEEILRHSHHCQNKSLPTFIRQTEKLFSCCKYFFLNGNYWHRQNIGRPLSFALILNHISMVLLKMFNLTNFFMWKVLVVAFMISVGFIFCYLCINDMHYFIGQIICVLSVQILFRSTVYI